MMAHRLLHRAAVLVVLGGLVVSPMSASAAQPSSAQALFEQGNALYLKGQYDAAARAYAEVITAHQLDDPAVYLNLGNVYVRLDRLGSAIFFYRRGLRLGPEEGIGERLERNLKATRRKLQQRYRASGETKAFIYTEPGGVLFRLTHVFGSATTVGLFLGFWAIFLALMIVRRLRANPSVLVGSVTTGAAILAVVTGLLLAGQVYTDQSFRLGVVVESNVTLKEGRHPDAEGQDLREGVEVRIVESDEEWVRVRRSDGAEGWVEAAVVRQI